MTELPSPNLRRTSNWSAIWILPLLALLIGGWLGWKAYNEAGIEVRVRFDKGDGIQIGKTQLIYKGISVGKVVDLKVTPDLQGVIATLEVMKKAEGYLSQDTRFWLVRPQVSLAGVTGLETLVSGIYIGVEPASGEPRRDFVALKEPPNLSDSQPGLHLTLKAERLGSLDKDSPVYYRQIQVGRVKSYQLGEDQRTVELKVYIEPAYSHLVRKHTRFWNASGLNVQAGLGGVKIHSESLLSLLAGGIAFATPEHRQDSPPTDPALPFRLYPDFDSAEAGVRVWLKLDAVEGLQKGTPVLFNGVQVGSLRELKMSRDLTGATAELTMEPRTEDLLLEGSEFWVVKPSISLAGVTGIDALVKGNYIAVRFAQEGQASRSFQALRKAPPLNLSSPGLHLQLASSRQGSLQVGSPLLYRQMRIGSVSSVELSQDRQQILFGVHVEPEYAHLVNSSSRFWNASGITLKGSLSGIEVKSESLQSLISGGIALHTPKTQAAALRQGQHLNLFDNEEQALNQGLLVELLSDSAEGLQVGTLLRYKGLEVGKVEGLQLQDDLQAVRIQLRVLQAGERIARQGSRFWLVKPKLGLARTANLDTLVSGQYLEVAPGPAQAPRQLRFRLQPQPDEAPLNNNRSEGLPLVLSTSHRGSLKADVAVTYRQVPVGKVTHVELGPNADRVLVHVLIEPRYAALVRSASRFWNASGIGVDFGLFKGAKLRAESLEALLEGGIAFATPDNPQMGGPAQPGQTFLLHDEVDERWLQWAPKISLPPAPR